MLPQPFREGFPNHPSYVAGHATVAGACVTVLNALFDEDVEIINPVIPKQLEGKYRRKVLDSNGNIVFEITTELEPYNSPPDQKLKVGKKLNKLPANIAIGRNWAGVHYRLDYTESSLDYTESILLGEEIAFGNITRTR